MPNHLHHKRDAATALRRFLYNAFILPFKDPARGFIYFTSFFFALGGAFLDVFLAIDIADMGQQQLMNFVLMKLGGLSLIIPLALYMIGRMNDKILYALLTLVTSGGLIMYIASGGDASPLYIGLLFACAISPFWAMYHSMFASATSDQNIGNEVSLAGTGMTVGMTFGSILGGTASQFDMGRDIGVYIGFLIIIGATLALIIKALNTGFSKYLKESGAMDETLFQASKRCKYRSVGSFLEGVIQPPSYVLWIVYLSLSGISAAAVGIWQAVMVLSKIVITPVAGSLVNHGRRREMLLGSGLNLLGWTPFLYGVQSFFVLLFMNIWAVGLQLFATGLTSAWYGSRTVAAIIVRELLMGIGRIICCLILIPLLYNSPQDYINTIIVISAVMVVYAALWMRSVKTKGPVLPIENIVTKGH